MRQEDCDFAVMGATLEDDIAGLDQVVAQVIDLRPIPAAAKPALSDSITHVEPEASAVAFKMRDMGPEVAVAIAKYNSLEKARTGWGTISLIELTTDHPPTSRCRAGQ